MRIALCSDEYYPIHEQLIEEVNSFGHEIGLFGALKTKKDVSWVNATHKAALAVSTGQYDEGIFCCFSGTGAAIVSNKVRGIRAALSTDDETAKLARIWNHANVLVLSNRLLNQQSTTAILKAWFETPFDSKGLKSVNELSDLDKKVRDEN